MCLLQRAHCSVHRFIESLLPCTCQSNMDESHKWLDSGALHKVQCKGQHKAPTTACIKSWKDKCIHSYTLDDLLLMHSTDEHFIYIHTSRSLMVVCYTYVHRYANNLKEEYCKRKNKLIHNILHLHVLCMHSWPYADLYKYCKNSESQNGSDLLFSETALISCCFMAISLNQLIEAQ